MFSLYIKGKNNLLASTNIYKRFVAPSIHPTTSNDLFISNNVLNFAYTSIAERKVLSTIIISDKSEHAEGGNGRDEESLPKTAKHRVGDGGT